MQPLRERGLVEVVGEGFPGDLVVFRQSWAHAKFAIVVMFFMHLKFDSKVLSGVFLGGLFLAAFMTTALIILFKVLPNYDFMG
jgi:hypothetical protein